MRFRVAVIGFIHESNTFTSLSTDMQDFRSTQYFLGQDVLAEFRNTGSEIGGCIDVVEEKGWAPDYIVGAHAQPRQRQRARAQRVLARGHRAGHHQHGRRGRPGHPAAGRSLVSLLFSFFALSPSARFFALSALSLFSP